MVSRNQYSDARTSSERVSDGTQSRRARAGAAHRGEAHDAQQAFDEHGFAALRVVGTAAALEGSTAHWNAIALRCCGRALHSGSSHGCWVESSWFLGYSYVSKALVCIILDAFAQVRRLLASVLQDASTGPFTAPAPSIYKRESKILISSVDGP